MNSALLPSAASAVVTRADSFASCFHSLQTVAIAAIFSPLLATAATLSVDVSDAGRHQRIDGFGTCTYSTTDTQQPWFAQLYYDDLRCSILRVDMTPRFKSPYSDWSYNSPWFHNNPPLPGPENNNVRTYTGPNDYSRVFAGKSAPIAVMGPDIETNIAVFDYDNILPGPHGTLAAVGESKEAELGGHKLLGCFWSPAPWVKVATGNVAPNYGGILPVAGTPWPFIWFDNFAGGKLDISGTPLEVLNDGTGPTSALTQYARSCAAYILGYQRRFGVTFDYISVQNEPGFEQFFNSATYKLSHEYITALKALAAEFANHPELQHIRFVGPDDLLGNDTYGLWQYGGGANTNHKNLQYLVNFQADPVVSDLLEIFSIHGYAADGVSAANADPIQWRRWAYGWTESPAPGIPANVPGFTHYGKKSWMTETSGENPAWLWPTSGFPNQGAWSLALRIHQALTVGQQSAWIYWQMSSSESASSASSLTGPTQLDTPPKYNAAKHFFRHIRPGAQRVEVVTENPALNASAYVHDGNQTLTYVVLNTGATPATFTAAVPSLPSGISSFEVYTSSNNNYWVASTASVNNGEAQITVPGYGVVTLFAQGSSQNVYSDSLSSGWTIEGPVASAAKVGHWESDQALRFTSPRKHTKFKITHPTGAPLTPNDLLQFYVRLEAGTRSIKRISVTLDGRKAFSTHLADLYIDGEPVHHAHIRLPDDGEWHQITIDLSSVHRPGLDPDTFVGVEIESDGNQQLLIDDIVLRSL